MSLIKDTWRQLVRNRLWPIALGLVAAAVAVPMLLAKGPTPAPAPAPAVSNTASARADRVALEPVVTQADETQTVRRRHVLGARKDPFAPAPQPKVKVKKVHVATSETPGVAGTGGSSTPTSGTGGQSGGSFSAPVTSAPVGPTPVATPKPKAKQFPGDSLTVRFGTGNGDPKSLLETGKPLPEGADDATDPLLVYLGLDKTGKQAIFLLDASVRADGDGRCTADAMSSCEELRMRAGDTEFLDVTDDKGVVAAQYELDLLAIHPSKKTRAAAAKAAKRHLAKDAKAVTAALATAAGASSARGHSDLGAGVGALLASL
jgi:hypothetical protein